MTVEFFEQRSCRATSRKVANESESRTLCAPPDLVYLLTLLSDISYLKAILRVLETDPTPSEILEILTDSAYSISCLSTWHKNWDKNGWKNASGQPVSNADLIKRILYLIRKRPFSGKLVFTHVRGHAGIEGNERADQLAVQGSYLPSKNERDYAAETDEDMLWDEVGDLPEDWADKLEFDIDTSTIPEAEMHS